MSEASYSPDPREIGTGMELIARFTHHCSNNNEKLFVAMNCAALPSTLVESELFGDERGMSDTSQFNL